jgi:glycosyltransferase involved in cell wall biosynthesis
LVVTNVPGSRHFVRDGVEGFVVPPDDPVALADALQCLARDPELRKRMGEAARLRLLHGFTEAHVKQSLRATYQSLLGANRGLMTPAALPALRARSAKPPRSPPHR